jgi:hypothetical protein
MAIPPYKADTRSIPNRTNYVGAQDINDIRDELVSHAADISNLALGTPSASSALVTASGGTTPRSLADRAADSPGPKDVGADSTGAADSQAAFAASLSAAGKSALVPAGTFKLVTPVPVLKLQRVYGRGPGSVVKPTGSAFTFSSDASTIRFYSGLHDLSLDGSASSDHLVSVVNSAVGEGPTFLSFQNVNASGWATNKAAWYFTNAHPLNTFDHLFLNAHAYNGAGHGLWIANSGGTQGSSIFNLIHSSFEGNSQHGLWLDVTGGGKPGIVNSIGTNYQGNTLSPIQVDGVSGMNLIGNYLEQAHLITSTPVVFSGASPSPGISIIGNGITGEANYGIDFNGTYAIEGVVSHSNVFTNQATAAYRITNLYGAVLGPDKLPAGKPSVDWASSVGWNMVQVWDHSAGTWSFTSDGTYFDQPKIGFGVKNTSLAAYLDLAGRQPAAASSGNGTAATKILKVTGPAGGNTTDAAGRTAGAGSDIWLFAGNGGTAPGGSTNGAGGNIILAPGAAGAGAGTAGTAGSVEVRGGVNRDGSGFKHKRLTTGSINAGARVDVTWTVSPAFADANYTAIATVYDASASGTGLRVERIRTQTASSVVVQVMNDSAGSLTGTLEVIAIHD